MRSTCKRGSIRFIKDLGWEATSGGSEFATPCAGARAPPGKRLQVRPQCTYGSAAGGETSAAALGSCGVKGASSMAQPLRARSLHDLFVAMRPSVSSSGFFNQSLELGVGDLHLATGEIKTSQRHYIASQQLGAFDHRIIETENSLRVQTGHYGKVKRISRSELQLVVTRQLACTAEFVPPGNGDGAILLRKSLHSGDNCFARFGVISPVLILIAAAEAHSANDHSLIARRSPDDSSQLMTASLFDSRMKTGTRALVSM